LPSKLIKYISISFFFLIISCGIDNSKFIGTITNDYKPLPQFNLIDQNNDSVDQNSFESKSLLITFLYSSCKTECPAVLNDLFTIKDILSLKSDELQVVIFSIDPLESSANVKNILNKYQLEIESLSYLMGTKEQLKPIWQYFYVPVGNVVTNKANSNLILHSTPAYLISPKESISLIYTEFDIKAIKSDLDVLVD
tara:strand:+ start:10877 stop:11464 length:588 start_codon:yes stop_codon:yes gene_type:complete